MTVNKISTLGTLHDLFLENPSYGLHEFVSAIEQFKPDYIFTEVRPENVTAAEASIEGGTEQSLIYAYASHHSIQIIPTDWFDEEFFQFMQTEAEVNLKDLLKNIWPDFEVYRGSFTSASLLDLNSEKTQSFVSEFEQAKEKVGLKATSLRNEKIFHNIRKELLKISGKRVLILFGMDHKHYIDERIKMMTYQKVLQVDDWFDSKQSIHFVVNEEVKKLAISHLNAAEDLLRKRLTSQFYPSSWEPALRNKIKNFSKWMTAIETL